MSRLHRTIARALVVCLCFAGLPIPAHAELISTDRVEAAVPAPLPARDRLGTLLDRADVRAALEKQGVGVDEARARVAALSDDEVDRLVARFDSLPAGGSVEGVLWLAFLVFLILLITDILGFTKVFPFTRPAK
jgi:uncharacterized protein DUF6627